MAEARTAVGVAGTAQRVALVSVAVLFAAWIVDYVDRLVVPVALPLIGQQFGLDKAAQGAILTSFFIAYALAQVPGGLLADRLGSRRVMAASMALWSLFTALTGIAFSFMLLLAVRFLFGASEGVFPGASMKAIAERVPRQSRLTANGVMLASNSLGAALAPLVAAPAIALAGWQRSFLYLAVPGLVMAGVIWWALPVAQSHAGELDARVTAGGGERSPALRLLRSGAMWRFTLLFFAFDLIAYGLVSWTPSYLIEHEHVALVETGLLTSIPWFAGAVGTVLGGVLFDRLLHDRNRLVIVPCALLTLVCLALMVRTRSAGAFIAWETVGVFFLSVPTIFGLPLRYLPTGVAATGMALINFGGQIGGAVAPLAMGVLADRFGFTAAFGFVVAGAGLAVVAALWAPQTRDELERSLARSTDAKPSVSE